MGEIKKLENSLGEVTKLLRKEMGENRPKRLGLEEKTQEVGKRVFDESFKSLKSK